MCKGNGSICNVTIIIRRSSFSAKSTVTNEKSKNHQTRNECDPTYSKHKLFHKDERTIIHRFFETCHELAKAVSLKSVISEQLLVS